jgi:hypothetical protein
MPPPPKRAKHTQEKQHVNQDSSQPDILQVRKVVAGNPNTPRQVLTRLATDEEPAIRRCVAVNPKTPIDVLRRLATDTSSEVRLAITENPNAPTEVLVSLATDFDGDVRYGVAENPHMPEDVLFQLSTDENPYVRCRAMKTQQMLAPDAQSRLKILLQQAFSRQQQQQNEKLSSD